MIIIIVCLLVYKQDFLQNCKLKRILSIGLLAKWASSCLINTLSFNINNCFIESYFLQIFKLCIQNCRNTLVWYLTFNKFRPHADKYTPWRPGGWSGIWLEKISLETHHHFSNPGLKPVINKNNFKVWSQLNIRATVLTKLIDYMT